MDLSRSLLNQFRQPKGWLGRLNVRAMNRRHSALTDWGLAHVSIGGSFTILDVGCGGGSTVSKLASTASEGKTSGIDRPEASVAASRSMNRKWIETGRVDIRHASVSQLPFPSDTFDLVTAVETHFYWPDLPADMQAVLRVLKPGGTLILIAEAYKGGKKDRVLGQFAEAMGRVGPYSHLSVDEHRELFGKAGFVEVQVSEEYEKGWICATGRKSRSTEGG
jgi:SAM-dependent methyltransferase